MSTGKRAAPNLHLPNSGRCSHAWLSAGPYDLVTYDDHRIGIVFRNQDAPCRIWIAECCAGLNELVHADHQVLCAVTLPQIAAALRVRPMSIRCDTGSCCRGVVSWQPGERRLQTFGERQEVRKSVAWGGPEVATPYFAQCVLPAADGITQDLVTQRW